MKVQQKLALAFIRMKLKLLTAINSEKGGEAAFKLFCTPQGRFSGRESEVFKNAERLQLKIDGKIIRGFRCNHPQHKKVLILHGFSSSCHNFHYYVAPLINKGYEVLAFDAPAHGASDGDTVNAVEYASMIKNVIKEYGPVTGFLAHSFGGLALSLALEEIPHDVNTRIVFIAPATETTSAIDSALQVLGIKTDKIKTSMNALIYKISGKEPTWYSIRRALHNISASILWVHDNNDDVTPVSDALKVKEDGHKHVIFHLTNGLGHRKIYKDQLVHSRVIDFF